MPTGSNGPAGRIRWCSTTVQTGTHQRLDSWNAFRVKRIRGISAAMCADWPCGPGSFSVLDAR